jgi:hypothetical protein
MTARSARRAADAYAGRATADNTRRPERAGVAPGATRALGRHGAAFLARLRGFAHFEGVCSLFINEMDEKVFTTSGGAGDGGGGDFGRRLGRQLQLELLDQE